MEALQHKALNWEALLTLAAEERAWTVFDEAEERGIASDPLLLHASFYAERLDLDSSALGDAYLASRPFYEEMDSEVVILDWASAHWPEGIGIGSYCPRFLFVKGNLALLGEPMASVLGTRTPSAEGRERAVKSVRSLARSGFVTLGGLSSGIEAAAHRAALNSGEPTVALIATPHNTFYPLSHMDLQLDIAKRGAVVSQFGPAAKNEKVHLLLRNRLMSAMARVLVIVEDRDGGTAVSQATWAHQSGKPIILYHQSSEDESLKWPQRFAKSERVRVVKRPQDLGRVALRLAGLQSKKPKDESPLSQLSLF